MDTQAQPLVWIGLDISKDTFDACLLKANGKITYKAFENTSKGFARLITWRQHTAPNTQGRFAMEATSAYGDALAEFLADADHLVSVLTPYLVSLFAKSLTLGNKTDLQSAKALALFAKERSPAL